MNDSKEAKRLQTLLTYGIIGTPREKEFDDLVELISLICDVPVAFISFIDDKRQWLKAKIGMEMDEAPIEETFCRHTILQDELLEIPDANLDDRVKGNPYVQDGGGIRFYAGVPLIAYNGHNIGTVGVLDSKPKQLSHKQKKALKLLTNQVMNLMDARRKNKSLGNELDPFLEKKIEKTRIRLQQKKTEFNDLLKAIKQSSVVVEFTPDGYIKKANAQFQKSVGYTQAELKGKHQRLILFEEQLPNNKAFWQSLQEGKFHSGRMYRKHKNGDKVWLQSTYNPILDRNGKVRKVIKISQDITLEMSSRIALQEAKEMAENLNVQKDNFIANVSHELRTPIHAILGFSELLHEQEQDVEKKAHLSAVKNAGDNLLFLINDILVLSKLESGMLRMDAAPFRIRETIKKVFSILELKAQQKNLEFTYHIIDHIPQLILGDKNRLSQILINLLGNALKFTKTGSVQLQITRVAENLEGINLQFIVTDTGIGIPKDKLETIFNRFEQADETTARIYGGTGLGLNISKQLIELQNGTITIESVVNKGSRFIFTIPYKPVQTVAESSENERNPSEGIWENTNILMCEDNELNQKLMQSLLQEKGINPTIAHNGLQGIEYLKSNEFDIVFMDLQMPEMDGYEAIEIIRNEMQLKVPVIALSANFLLEKRQKCLELGMNDYLSKPFSREELFEIINEWCPPSQRKQRKELHSPKLTTKKHSMNLEMLQELSGGDKEFEAEMLELFESQTKEMYAELKHAAEDKNTALFRNTAHKLKTSIGIVGADATVLNKMEKLSLENENNTKPLLMELEYLLDDIYLLLKSRH